MKGFLGDYLHTTGVQGSLQATSSQPKKQGEDMWKHF